MCIKGRELKGKQSVSKNVYVKYGMQDDDDVDD